VSNKFNPVHFLKPIPVWMRYNNDFPVKVMAWAHSNGSGLVVGRHTDITDFSQLGGKQVAVPFWYSMHNIVLQYALRASGVTPVIKAQGEPRAPNECNLHVMPPARDAARARRTEARRLYRGRAVQRAGRDDGRSSDAALYRRHLEEPSLLRRLHARGGHHGAPRMDAEGGERHGARRDPSELSGGRQERVTIARALAGAPRIVFADEPTGNLDTHRSAEIMELLRDLNRREGQTIVMVAHEDDTAHCAERLIWMVDGRFERDGPSASHGTGAELAG